MPGLFGLLVRDGRLPQRQARLMCEKMGEAMRSRPWLSSTITQQANYCGGQIGMDPSPRPVSTGAGTARVLSWLEGEIFRPDDHGSYQRGEETFVARLASGIDAELQRAEGAFCMAVYDTATDQLILVSDRLGLRPLYIMETNDFFAYASEIKALLAVLPKTPSLDMCALRQFFAFDYMLGNRTWWKGISLLPPSSQCTVSRGGTTIERYWTFDAIERKPLPVDEVLQRWRRLWSQAVSRYSKPGVTPFLLSGGLDSRCLLAELRLQGREVVAFTWGMKGCSDLRIAARVARMAGVLHRPLVMDENNWWNGREEAIWQIDGMVNCLHLQACTGLHDQRMGNRWSPMNMAGDLLFGGSYLSRPVMDSGWRDVPSELMRNKYLPNPLVSREDALAESLPDIRLYVEGPSTDCFYLLQRVRRFTNNGPLVLSAFSTPSYPSLSNDLLALMLGGCDDAQRSAAALYKRFLLDNYPLYYRDVPWQATGRGFEEHGLTAMWRDAARHIRPHVPVRCGGWRLRRALDWAMHQPVDHEGLLRRSSVIPDHLKSKLLADDVLHGKARAWVTDESGRVDVGTKLRILTFEIYLRQVSGSGCVPVLC